MLENYIKTKTKTNLILKQIKSEKNKMSQNMDSGTDSQLSKYMLEVEDHQLAISDASDTINFWNNRVNIMTNCPSLLKTLLLRLQVRPMLKRFFFCVRPAYCWSQKQNDQVIANMSLFETWQKILANTGINASVWNLEL